MHRKGASVIAMAVRMPHERIRSGYSRRIEHTHRNPNSKHFKPENVWWTGNFSTANEVIDALRDSSSAKHTFVLDALDINPNQAYMIPYSKYFMPGNEPEKKNVTIVIFRTSNLRADFEAYTGKRWPVHSAIGQSKHHDAALLSADHIAWLRQSPYYAQDYIWYDRCIKGSTTFVLTNGAGECQ